MIPDVYSDISDCVNIITKSVNAEQAGIDTVSSIKINPNNLCGIGDILNYHEFEIAFDSITATLGIDLYMINRCDFRLDSYDLAFYECNAKIMRYLCLAYTIAYSVQNKYETFDLLSSNRLSICCKNRYFEFEFYNKFVEDRGRSGATARLELRSKNFGSKSIKEEFTNNWIRRGKKALEHLEAVQKHCNKILLDKYNAEMNAIPKKFTTVDEFLRQNQDRIFTRKQLVELLSKMLDIDKRHAEYKADNFKRLNGIELFSNSDMYLLVDGINRAIEKYFNS